VTGTSQYRIGLALAAAAFLLWSTALAVAQQPRVRALKYDADRKTWVEVPPPPPGTPEGDLHVIRALIKDAKYRQALAEVKAHVKRYGQSHPLYPEVLIAKAEALVGKRAYDKAHVTLQTFLGEFAGLAATSDALRLEFTVAEAYLSGAKRKVWGILRLSGEDVAFGILDEISTDYPDSEFAELAVKTKGDYLFRKGEHALAELEYARVLRDHPQSRYHQYSLRRTAESALASFAGVDYDESGLIEAEERYRDYRARYAATSDHEGVGTMLEGIQELRAEKEFSTGRYYERTDHLSSAVYYYRLVRDDWPGTIAADKATSRLELLGAMEPVSSTGG